MMTMHEIRAAGGDVDWRGLLQRLLRESSYLVVSFPLAVGFFCLTVTALAMGAATAIIWVGIPILGITLTVVGAFADIERRATSELAGRDIPRPRYLPAQGLRGLLTPLTDQQRWLDVVWVLVHFLCASATFALTVTWWAAALWVPLGPVFGLIQLVSPLDSSLFGLSAWLTAILQYLLAVVCLITLPWVVHVLASIQSSLSHLLLGTRGELEQQVDHLHRSRDAAHDAEVRSLHRLERDIHDGPQQRLVRLQLDLARAERAAASDPERARELVASARQQATETLTELRQLSRGIAPPVLQDRGLCVALEELAARSEVIATLDCRGLCHGRCTPGRCTRCGLPPVADHVLAAAYFVAAEAVTNANKHSLATRIDIDVNREPHILTVTVTDNGVGGASLAKGHGLAGLAERLRGLDGTLHVDSPTGGPTVVQACLPCGS